MYNRPGPGITGKSAALLFCGAVLILAGCRTLPGKEAFRPVPFPEDALVVASFDTAFLGNEYLLAVEKKFGADAAKILSRADFIDFALFPENQFSLLLDGRFNRITTSLALDFSSDWNREAGGERRWRNANGIDEISIPRAGIVAYGVPETSRLISSWTERFEKGLSRNTPLYILIPDMQKNSPGLPVSGECRIVGMAGEESLRLSIRWQFDDPRRARTAVPLVKLTLWGFFRGLDKQFDTGSIDLRLEGDTILIEGLAIRPEAFSALVDMIFRSNQ